MPIKLKEKCPNCESGEITLQEGENGRRFYKCNFCDYQISSLIAVENNLHCPECGDFLLPIKGRPGKKPYFKCHRIGCGYILKNN